jgi:hypothetical protein
MFLKRHIFFALFAPLTVGRFLFATLRTVTPLHVYSFKYREYVKQPFLDFSGML